MIYEQHFGISFKKIRLSKNYSQQRVYKNIMHQTTYSKFELGKIQLTFEKFKSLLINIEMSFEEFQFIHNAYNYSARDKIINSYKNMKFIEINLLDDLKELAEYYLNIQEDEEVSDILHAVNAFINFKKTNDFNDAKIFAEDIWKRLQKIDTWYLSELRLVNSILFLFPIETAISITKFAILQARKYKNFENHMKIILPFKYNLVHLLIKEKKLEEASIVNNEIIEDFKKQKHYVQLALSYIRKGLLQPYLIPQDNTDYINKAYNIAEALDDHSLTAQLNNEKKYILSLLS